MTDKHKLVKLDMKHKCFARGARGKKYKRFKKTPQYVKDNPENQIAREKDIFDFSGSDDDFGDTHLTIKDLTFLSDNVNGRQKDLIALTQDSVRPLFMSEADYDEGKLLDALADLKYKNFRPNQHETVKRILFGRSTLFISPTGSGKSLCYQLPALLYWKYRRYITIVVSPLISLMDDQMSSFPTCLTAVSLHSGHTRQQKHRCIDQLVAGQAQVAFISPEAIVSGALELDDLRNLPPIGFVCIDEAHCLSEWSHNFRPAYLQFFRILNEQMNIKTYLGLTATSTTATSLAISRNLVINPDTDVVGSTTIPDNLILSVTHETNKEKALIDLLKTPSIRILPSIIIYCNRREQTERIAMRIRTALQNYSTLIETPEKTKRTLSSKDNLSQSSAISDTENPETQKSLMKLTWNAEAYHAGLSMDTRKRIQRQFIKGEVRVVCATIAFGMGINKSNVRAIIHYDMPNSFESYVQEIGRAGRDGKPAQCHMFLKADRTDLYYQQRNIYANTTERKNLRKLIDLLFKPCNCENIRKMSKKDMEALDKLNQIDVHEIKSYSKNEINEIEKSSLKTIEKSKSASNENEFELDSLRKKNVRKSVVRRHRACKGHEVAFSVEKASSDLNLKPESIITLICQLQQAYPKLQLKLFTPARSTCSVFCYMGSKQMDKLAQTSKPIFLALLHHKRQYKQTYGEQCETPQEITFDVMRIAADLGKSSFEVTRMLKQTEWELNEKTGGFRRSQIRVKFEGNDFHLNAVGDLNGGEIEEISTFLYDFQRLYEDIERQKLIRVFNTLFRHSISMSNMSNKTIRLEASARLKKALNSYFTSEHTPIIDNSNLQLNNAVNDQTIKLTATKIQTIRQDARAFISAHGKREFTPRIISRIFQGISTPNYSAENWGTNKKWWRIHLDVDFLQLCSLIQEQLLCT